MATYWAKCRLFRVRRFNPSLFFSALTVLRRLLNLMSFIQNDRIFTSARKAYTPIPLLVTIIALGHILSIKLSRRLVRFADFNGLFYVILHMLHNTCENR